MKWPPEMHMHKYFRCWWCRRLLGRQWCMDGHERHIGWCFWMLDGGWVRFGVHWFGVGRAMRVIASDEECRHGLMSKISA